MNWHKTKKQQHITVLRAKIKECTRAMKQCDRAINRLRLREWTVSNAADYLKAIAENEAAIDTWLNVAENAEIELNLLA